VVRFRAPRHRDTRWLIAQAFGQILHARSSLPNAGRFGPVASRNGVQTVSPLGTPDGVGGLVNGPAHFQKAEEILAGLEQRSYGGETEISLVLQALTHATLAHAAAAALGTSAVEGRAWAEAAGTRLSG